MVVLPLHFYTFPAPLSVAGRLLNSYGLDQMGASIQVGTTKEKEVVMVDEADLQYLRNINTKPGANAGRSIDPSKPGPDSILHELGKCPARPTGNNADEWQLFLQEWLSIVDGRISGTGFVAVQIAEAIDAALAQSHAEPWRCPIGISPAHHGICSAGTCWWCLSDRVKAQSDPKSTPES